MKSSYLVNLAILSMIRNRCCIPHEMLKTFSYVCPRVSNKMIIYVCPLVTLNYHLIGRMKKVNSPTEALSKFSPAMPGYGTQRCASIGERINTYRIRGYQLYHNYSQHIIKRVIEGRSNGLF